MDLAFVSSWRSVAVVHNFPLSIARSHECKVNMGGTDRIGSCSAGTCHMHY
jgi:hypothetical protein